MTICTSNRGHCCTTYGLNNPNMNDFQAGHVDVYFGQIISPCNGIDMSSIDSVYLKVCRDLCKNV